MHLCPGLYSLQLLDNLQYPLPNRKAVQVASLEYGVRPHGGLDRCALAVVLYLSA
jgi:hypothetical protein